MDMLQFMKSRGEALYGAYCAPHGNFYSVVETIFSELTVIYDDQTKYTINKVVDYEVVDGSLIVHQETTSNSGGVSRDFSSTTNSTHYTTIRINTKSLMGYTVNRAGDPIVEVRTFANAGHGKANVLDAVHSLLMTPPTPKDSKKEL